MFQALVKVCNDIPDTVHTAVVIENITAQAGGNLSTQKATKLFRFTMIRHTHGMGSKDSI